MLAEVGYGLAAAGALALAMLVAHRFTLPSSVLFVAVGVGFAYLPGPTLTLDPDILLVLVIPPLLYSAALDASVVGIRANRRSIVSLSVGLVLVTALGTGGALAAAVPGLGFAAALALASAVAPTDAIAALSVGRRVGLPGRMVVVIEGEGLLNDGTALTLYTVAAAAATGGGFSPVGVGARFLYAAGGGVAIGVAVAWIVQVARRRLEEPLVETTLSLATPFLAYLPAEEAHASGVLAVVVVGLWIGHRSPRLLSGPSRLHTRSVWALVDMLLEGFVFLLIGEQLPAVVRGLRAYPPGVAAAAIGVTVGLVVAIRLAWIVLPSLLPRRGGHCATTDPELSRRELVALSWAGMRGVISLAAAFALPQTAHGASFPYRDLLLACAYGVVLFTLAGQGLTFAPLLRWLGVEADHDEVARQRALARAAGAEAGLRVLDQLVAQNALPESVARRLRATAEHRRRRSRDALSRLDPEEDDEGENSSQAYARGRYQMIEAERDEIVRWRDAGRLADESLRRLERELDLEEGGLPTAAPPP